jgi:hypothetical protein
VTLDVTGGGLVGSVPTELGVLPRLRRLDLSRNELVGIIPSQLGELSRLGTYLNRLCSAVACSSCSLSPLVYNVLYAEKFFVQDKNLTGKVPTKMCALRSLGLEDFRVDCNSSVVCESPQCCTMCY